MSHELERIWKESAVVLSRYSPERFLEGGRSLRQSSEYFVPLSTVEKGVFQREVKFTALPDIKHYGNLLWTQLRGLSRVILRTHRVNITEECGSKDRRKGVFSSDAMKHRKECATLWSVRKIPLIFQINSVSKVNSGL